MLCCLETRRKFGRKGVIFGIWPKDIFGQMPDAGFDNAAIVTYMKRENT